MPEVPVDDEQITVEACNCPFAALVDAPELPCSAEACFYETLFDRVERACHMPAGAPTCVYELPVLQQ